MVVGEKEVSENTVTVRTRDNIVHGAKNVDEFIKQLIDEVQKEK